MTETSYVIYKLISLLFALLIIYWGYRLLVIGLFNKTEETNSIFGKNGTLLKKAAPGIFFSLFGTLIFFYIVFKGTDYNSKSSLDLQDINNPQQSLTEMKDNQGLESILDYNIDTLYQKANDFFDQQKLVTSIKYYNVFLTKADKVKIDSNKLNIAKTNIDKAKTLLQNNFTEIKYLQMIIERGSLQLKKNEPNVPDLKKEIARLDSLKKVAKLYSSYE